MYSTCELFPTNSDGWRISYSLEEALLIMRINVSRYWPRVDRILTWTKMCLFSGLCYCGFCCRGQRSGFWQFRESGGSQTVSFHNFTHQLVFPLVFHNFNTCFLCCDEFLEIDNCQVSWQMRCLEWRLYMKDLNFNPSTIHSWRNVVPQLVLQCPFHPSCVRARVSGLHQVHQAEDWPRGSTHLGGLLTQQSQPNTHIFTSTVSLHLCWQIWLGFIFCTALSPLIKYVWVVSDSQARLFLFIAASEGNHTHIVPILYHVLNVLLLIRISSWANMLWWLIKYRCIVYS